MLDAFRLDLRYSARRLRANPAFSALLVLTLALGIGANVAVFSALYGLVFKPLPYPDSERLVQIYNSYPKRGVLDSANTIADYLDRRDQADALVDVALYYSYSYDLAIPGAPLRLQGVSASPSLFSTLQVSAQLGRTFTEAEAQADVDRVVLLSDGLWRRQFGADPEILGQTIRLSGQAYTVIGVMPASFGFPSSQVQLWVPAVFNPRQMSDQLRGFEFAQSIGRLKPEATIAQLEAQFAAIIQGNIERLGGVPNSDAGGSSWIGRALAGGFEGRAVSLHEYRLGDRPTVLWLLQAAVALVLAIACANVANLMLISFHRRQRELSLRAALGASRLALIRQLLIESALISILGGGLGLLLALVGVQLLRSAGLDGADAGFAIALDLKVALYGLLCVVLTTVVCGLLPAAGLSRANHATTLSEGTRGSAGSRPARRLRAALVVAQISLSVVLLASGGLLLRSYLQLRGADPGFLGARILTVSGQLSRDRYKETEVTRDYLDALLETVRALPGVQDVGLISSLPFSADYGSGPYFIDGDSIDNGKSRIGHMQTVDEHFFDIMQIPLLKGRTFLPSDDIDTPQVTIIDAELARHAFGDRDPIGERLATPGIGDELRWRTIVGVVDSIKRDSLSQQSSFATYYAPHRQSPSRIFRLVIQTDLPVAQLAEPLRAAALKVDPEQPLYDLVSMNERIDRSLDVQRQPLRLIVLFAAIALALAAIGIYAVLAFGVAQRRSEIGVRLSLGAQRGDIVRLIMVDGVRLVGTGLALGCVLWLLLAGVLRSQLYQVSVGDPFTAGSVLLLTLITALIATWVPARLAAAIEPSQALRAD